MIIVINKMFLYWWYDQWDDVILREKKLNLKNTICFDFEKFENFSSI